MGFASCQHVTGMGDSYDLNVVNWGYEEVCEGEGKCFSYSHVAHQSNCKVLAG